MVLLETGGYLQVMANDAVDLARLKPWFAKVYDHHKLSNPKQYNYNEDTIRVFLYPCFAFDEAKGFADLTKLLAYQVAGHITEFNPTDDSQNALHLRPNVMGKSKSHLSSFMDILGNAN